MRFKVDFILNSSWQCFHKYLVYYSKVVYEYINREERRIYSIETYISYLKIAKLDDFFNDSLSKEEKEALEEWVRERNVDYKLPHLVKRSFEKWKIVFISDKYDYLFSSLNSVSLGIVLRATRELNMKTQGEISKLIGVNRKTIYLIENGQRLPSLEFIYRFARIFQASVDELLELSLNH